MKLTDPVCVALALLLVPLFSNPALARAADGGETASEAGPDIGPDQLTSP